MNRVQWKSRRTIGVLLALIMLYFTIRVGNYEHKMIVFLPKVHPNEPWEFVADFSNMMYLNPTILEFSITEESGNYDHWKYTIEYSERLSIWPYLPSYATAYFQVKATPKKDAFFINSFHKTCMFANIYCLDSDSEFKFTMSNHTNGTVCEETVIYQCPFFLSKFCRREVQYQRIAVINNLKKKFLGH